MFYQNPHSNIIGKNWLRTQIATRKDARSKLGLRCTSSRFRQPQAVKKQLNANQLLRGYKGASQRGAYFIYGTTWKPKQKRTQADREQDGVPFKHITDLAVFTPGGWRWEGGRGVKRGDSLGEHLKSHRYRETATQPDSTLHVFSFISLWKSIPLWEQIILAAFPFLPHFHWWMLAQHG